MFGCYILAELRLIPIGQARPDLVIHYIKPDFGLNQLFGLELVCRVRCLCWRDINATKAIHGIVQLAIFECIDELLVPSWR